MQHFRADCAIECDQKPVLTGSSRERVGGLVPGDDAKNNDLIFVGSPSENLAPLEIPGAQEFVFKRVPSGPRKGDLSIVNVHPQPDEEKAFLATPSKQPLSGDYAVVVLVRWIQSGAISEILAGTTTFGPQGAAHSNFHRLNTGSDNRTLLETRRKIFGANRRAMASTTVRVYPPRKSRVWVLGRDAAKNLI